MFLLKQYFCQEMKPMNDKAFVDSNIFLYAFSDKDKEKQEIASNIILQKVNISTQVVNEVSNNMLRKLKFSNSEIIEFIKSCYTRYDIINFSEEIFIVASEIREHYNISYYDSLIVSAGLQAGATVLYSEDMQHQLKINDTLTIVNPFV